MQLTRTDILEKLKDILLSIDEANKEKVMSADESLNLKEDFGFTSINTLFLVIAIEETFSLRFDDVSMDDFKTIGDVITYIEGKIQ